ncbi:MAG: O-antigen ligase family protein [Acidobacteria bacterium]|nr:O-antigen ligase family protein [Acidobacteriota bacterium]
MPAGNEFWFLTVSVVGGMGIISLYAAILRDWRVGVYGLIIFMPFAGVPTILLYPAPAWTKLLKDLLFVLPVYASFMLWMLFGRGARKRPGSSTPAPLAVLGLMAALLLVHLLNPRLTNLWVGVIGLKLWVLYVPFYFLGYRLLDSEQRLFKVARLMLVSAIIPALVGITEAVLIYSGFSDVVYGLYGDAAASVTQKFAMPGLGEDRGLARIPSTFAFAAQYSMFLLGMLPLSYALWHTSGQGKRRRRRFYLLALCLIVLAALTSGSRGALILTPLYFFLVVAVDGKWRRHRKIIGVAITGFVLTAFLVGVSATTLFSYGLDVLWKYASVTTPEGLFNEFVRAFRLTWIGLGTGMSSGPARYAFDEYTVKGSFGAVESFYAKVIVELGIPGLVLVLVFFGWLLMRGYQSVARLRESRLRAFGVALLAFFIMQVAYLAKGSYLDYDPLNVYFWLFAGFLMKLQGLERESHGSVEWARRRMKPYATPSGKLVPSLVAKRR